MQNLPEHEFLTDYQAEFIHEHESTQTSGALLFLAGTMFVGFLIGLVIGGIAF